MSKESLGAKTIAYSLPVWLVGSYDGAGQANMMAVAWGGICCSKPPCVNVCLRAATHSYQALVDRQAFTVSIPGAEQLASADFCGIASGRDTDKFAALGWTAVRSDLVDAPYAQECALVLECRVRHQLEIGLHTLFVGEILDVKAETAILNERGRPDPLKLGAVTFDPANRGYHACGARLGQAFAMGKDAAG